MGLNVSEQECNNGKNYEQKGTLCGPNTCNDDTCDTIEVSNFDV